MSRRGAEPARRWLVAGLASWACVGALVAPAAGQDGPTAMIVFDNSGSMWGKIEGSRDSKLVLARDAIEAALEKLKPGVRTGLVTFGRRRGDCGDIEVVARPDVGDHDRITTPLDKLNPKGRGPIIQSVREAARAIGPARPGTVILIHDDPDNCQQDPCAAAADLKREQPGLRVQLISIGLKKDDAARMSCLAEQTGGRQFEVANAGQIMAALDEALALGEGGKPPPAPVPAVRPAAPEAAVKPSPVGARKPSLPPAQGGPGLWLSAVLAADGDLVDGPVNWRVLKTSGGIEAAVFEALAGEVRAELPPGAYTVEARYGLVTARRPVEVAAGTPTPAVVAMGAGALRITARAQTGGPFIDQVSYALYSAAAGENKVPAKSPPQAPVWIGRDPSAAVGMPAGSYRLVAERGFARAHSMVTVTAGVVTQVDVALGAGLLTLRAAAKDDGETLPDALFILAAEDPEAPQGQRELTRSAAAAPDFVVPAGTYTVTTRVGGSEVRDRVTVGAGESVKRTMILALGKLVMSARLDQPAGQPPWREAMSFRVVRRDGDQREMARTSVSPSTLELPAGAYRIEVQVGTQNAVVLRDVEIQAGRTTQLALELPAARAALRLVEPLAGAGDVVWEVRDETGRNVWRGTQAEPRLVLAPGRYSVRVSVRDKRIERSLTLRTGESRSLEVGTE